MEKWAKLLPLQFKYFDQLDKQGTLEVDYHLIGQQGSKFVEGGDFCRAGSGELFLNALHHGVRQLSTNRADDAFAVLLCRQLRIDFQSGESGNRGNRGDAVADGLPEHLTNVRGRISTDQEDLLALSSQTNRSGAGNRCFPHATLAGEKQEDGCVL